MDFVPSILFQYSVIDNEVYDLLKVNMRIEKCEEGTEWTEQGKRHCNCVYQARALRALGLLLADGTPTVGGGKTF